MTVQRAVEQPKICEMTSSDRDRGTPIYCPDGTLLGTIEQLMIDRSTGTAVYVVMRRDAPGGAKVTPDYYPLPWSLLTRRPGRNDYEAELNSQELAGAPRFFGNESWDWDSRERGQFVHDYYNVPPYWGM